MLSNPMPLFALADLDRPELPPFDFDNSVECDRDGCCDPVAPLSDPCDVVCNWDWSRNSVGRFIANKRCSLPDFQIVNITDPNDLFSYNLEGIKVTCGDGETKEAFANAKVRNVKWSYFGLINPVTAHSGYGRNCSVLGMILYGNRCCTCSCHGCSQ